MAKKGDGIYARPRAGETEATCTRWDVPIYNRATQKQDWRTIKGSRKAAERFKREQMVAMDAGDYVSTRSRELFVDTAAEYIKRLEAVGRATATLTNARSILNLYLCPALESVNTQRITVELYEKRVATPMVAKGRSSDVLARTAKVMKAVMFRAMQRQIVGRNPFQRYQNELVAATPRPITRMAYTEEQLQAIFDAAGSRRTMLMLFAYTGIRIGECFALRRRDLDLGAGLLHVRHSWEFRGIAKDAPLRPNGKPMRGRLKETKTGEERTLPLTGGLIEALRDHLGTHESEWVFPSRDGRPHQQDGVPKWWNAILDAAGVPRATPYSLRHSYCSILANAGAPKHVIVQSMGHKTSTLYERVYVHATQKDFRDAANLVASRLSKDEQPKLRVINGRAKPVIRKPLDENGRGKVRSA